MTIKRKHYKSKHQIVVKKDDEKTKGIEKYLRKVILAYANPDVQQQLAQIRDTMNITEDEEKIPEIHKQVCAELYSKFFGELKL